MQNIPVQMSPGWLISSVRLLVPAARFLTSLSAEMENPFPGAVHGDTYPDSTKSGTLYGVKNCARTVSMLRLMEREGGERRTAEKGYSESQSEL